MENIILPKSPEVLKKDGNTTVFEIKPCHPGYGLTLGNALKRVLISSLSGAAITSIFIKEASHEFSTIPNVLEDVMEIILNLKQIRVKMEGEEEVSATIKVSGEKEVKSGDIVFPSGVSVVNKDQHIATLTDKKATFEMALNIKKGIGYVPAEKNEPDETIGTISIDAIYSPIVKVNYNVENMRVGQMTNYNKITLEIETDGSVDPEKALDDAIQILVGQFGAIAGQEVEESIIDENSEKSETDSIDDIEKLELSKRTVGILKDNEIVSTSELVGKTKDELSDLPGMGAKGIEEIKSACEKEGISLKA